MTVTDEDLLRGLLADRALTPVIGVLNDVLGGPIDKPDFATWRAVDADAIRHQGLWQGAHDTGLAHDLNSGQWQMLADRLEPLGVDVTARPCPIPYQCGPGCVDATHQPPTETSR